MISPFLPKSLKFICSISFFREINFTKNFVKSISRKNLLFLGFLSKLVDKKDVSDPFVDVKLGKARLAKTSIIDNNLNPTWNENYRLEVCHFANELTFEIRDKDHAYSELIGYVEIPTAQFMTGQPIEGDFPIKKRSNSSKTRGTLQVKVVFR